MVAQEAITAIAAADKPPATIGGFSISKFPYVTFLHVYIYNVYDLIDL